MVTHVVTPVVTRRGIRKGWRHKKGAEEPKLSWAVHQKLGVVHTWAWCTPELIRPGRCPSDHLLSPPRRGSQLPWVSYRQDLEGALAEL